MNHDERASGSIEVGKRADLAVLDHDVFGLRPARSATREWSSRWPPAAWCTTAERMQGAAVSLAREAVERRRAGPVPGAPSAADPPTIPTSASAVGAGGAGRPAGADLPCVPASTGRTGLRAWTGARRAEGRACRRCSARSCAERAVIPTRERGRLAQLEERRPYKAKVGGSRPSAPTIKRPVQIAYCPPVGLKIALP